ncbi:hypothetical protein C8R42DRAFT_743342 [Lentinula raphanica]|nr:hypothetical protein C8R42DRAFT_743342 [Lentinula raphanica]
MDSSEIFIEKAPAVVPSIEAPSAEHKASLDDTSIEGSISPDEPLPEPVLINDLGLEPSSLVASIDVITATAVDSGVNNASSQSETADSITDDQSSTTDNDTAFSSAIFALNNISAAEEEVVHSVAVDEVFEAHEEIVTGDATINLRSSPPLTTVTPSSRETSVLGPSVSESGDVVKRGQILKNPNIAQYFDLEAQVDSDNEDYDSEHESEVDFIDDRETITSHAHAPTLAGPLFATDTVPESAFLDHLAQTYGPRDLSTSSSFESSSLGTSLSQIDKIRLNNAEDRDLASELRAVYHNHNIVGVIFLEARFLRKQAHNHNATPLLLDTLNILRDIRLSSLRVVPEDEYVASLKVKQSPDRFHTIGDWVTISHGLYKGDVGLVVGHAEAMGAGEHNVRVLLVPRLAFKFDADRDEFEETRSSPLQSGVKDITNDGNR